jgi:spore maturation protein CgeB
MHENMGKVMISNEAQYMEGDFERPIYHNVPSTSPQPADFNSVGNHHQHLHNQLTSTVLEITTNISTTS